MKTILSSETLARLFRKPSKKACQPSVRAKLSLGSLGCTIVEMFTTEPPFYKVSEEEFLASVEARILSYDPECLIPKASPSMQLFLSLLLQNDNGKRPQTGSEAEVKLNQIF
uniref:Protein kinase domain-containing protein n=1 Tax=Plectus sambesii TaxID=2011161 RepID=A0A914VTW6_9BILA